MQGFTYKMRVPKEALDSLGHVNHAYYLTLFELARWDILVQKELKDELMLKRQIGPIILEANVKYRHELKVDNEVIIQTRFEPFKRDQIFKAIQTMHILKDGHQKGEETLISEGDFLAAFMDLKKRKMTPVPADLKQKLFEM